MAFCLSFSNSASSLVVLLFDEFSEPETVGNLAGKALKFGSASGSGSTDLDLPTFLPKAIQTGGPSLFPFSENPVAED